MKVPPLLRALRQKFGHAVQDTRGPSAPEIRIAPAQRAFDDRNMAVAWPLLWPNGDMPDNVNFAQAARKQANYTTRRRYCALAKAVVDATSAVYANSPGFAQTVVGWRRMSAELQAIASLRPSASATRAGAV